MLIKLLVNIFIFYAIWQIIRMFLSVKKAQDQFQRQVNDLNNRVNHQAPPQKPREKKNEVDGDYIDFEEIK